ncbi:hypothetical protein B0H34DRAFT_661343 [Crassisporium funariophilum]|nr:hypothetical protein B0H34DRAFT_661343 [Crassisporium funariophilum]
MTNTRARVPTVNDLRVKLCYICREEELDAIEDPPRAWTHPCSCTLIAHEQCLLKWIQTSQASTSRAPNALKCPQCGTAYELESDKPVILRVLDIGNKTFQRLGRYFTVFGAAGTMAVIGTSVYICLTAYGAWAVEKFIGREMFNTLLTDDPTNWPWSAYINLPLLPISLILSRFQTSSNQMIIPLLLVWPPSSPVGDRGRRLFDFWSKPENAIRLTQMSLLPTHTWPPPPLLFGLFGLPILRIFYRRLYAHVYFKLMGTPMPIPRPLRRGLVFNEGPFVIRIRAEVDGVNDQARQQQQAAPVANDRDPANPDPNAAAVEAAEQLIDINAASLGRRIAGALVVPAISSFMGTLLFRLSRRSDLLRSFLGIRARVSGSYPLPPMGRFSMSHSDKRWSELSLFQQSKTGMELFMNAIWGGSRTFVDSDPVWWRNGVGFGLFVVIKDCVQLLHLYLAKRELESRRVKDRDFSGVDVRELDLLPSFPRS